MPHLSSGKHSPPSRLPAQKKAPLFNPARQAAAGLIASPIEMFKHQQHEGLSLVFVRVCAYVFACALV